MKKILFLLLSTIAMYGQVPADATQLENIQITNNAEDLTAEKVNVQSANGVLNWQLINDFQNNKPYFSTGLLKNGLLTINADNTKFDLSAGIGVYSDFSDPENVTSKVFNFPAFNAVLSPYIATSNITYVAVNYNGGSPVLVMQASKFSNTQLRDLVVVGAVVHSNFTTINTINNISSPSNDVGNSVADLFNFLGAKNQEGNVYSANGANLQLNKSAGVMFKYGANFHVDLKNPHNVFLPEQLSLTFRYRLRGGFEGTDRINIDTDNYDLNNVLTTVPPAKPYQIQTIFIPQTGQTRIAYGQDTYNTLADAIAAINTRKFVTETNLASQFVKVAYLVVKKGATFLNVAADADIRQATQFDGTASGGVALTYQSIIDALGYVPENVVNKVTSLALPNNTTYPTSLAVKTYADNLVVGMLNDRGSWDASVNLFPTTGGSGAAGAIRKGDMWYISIAGTLGGKSVNVGDSFRALVNAPAQVASNWSVLEANIGYVPANDANVIHTTGNETRTGSLESGSFIKSGVSATNILLAGGSDITQLSLPISSATQTALNSKVSTVTGSGFIVSTGGVNPNLTISTAGASNGGALTSADWNVFNNKEPAISPKNTAFNKNFGTTAGTVAEGNDSRILNGQTAFGWGNHSTFGYALDSNVLHRTGNENISTSSLTWPNATNSDSNNYINNKSLAFKAGNNGMYVIGDALSNSRRFGFQVGHGTPTFASTVGTLELNPFGGSVVVNGVPFIGSNITNWNTAFSWGDHASQNYVSGNPILSNDWDSIVLSGLYYNTTTSAIGIPVSEGFITVQHIQTSSNATQLAIRTESSQAWFRRKDAGTWSAWLTLINSGNFNTFSPSLTGTGATGSWNINASTSTTLQTARNLTIGSTAKSFNGSANVSWSLAEIGAEPIVSAATTADYYRGDKTWQPLNKTAVELSNVDNTSDLNKPISTATQTALVLKAPLNSPTFTGSVKVPDATLATEAVNKGQLDAVAATSGTYTPTLTNTLNVTSATLEKAVYTRIGNIVSATISLTADVTTGSTPAKITVSLPINRLVTTQLYVGNGVGFLTSPTNSSYNTVFNVPANTTDVILNCRPLVAGVNTFVGIFSYSIN